MQLALNVTQKCFIYVLLMLFAQWANTISDPKILCNKIETIFADKLFSSQFYQTSHVCYKRTIGQVPHFASYTTHKIGPEESNNRHAARRRYMRRYDRPNRKLRQRSNLPNKQTAICQVTASQMRPRQEPGGGANGKIMPSNLHS